MKGTSAWLGIIAIAFAITVIGCPEEEPQVRKELYSVKILSVTPDLIDGVEQELSVTVEYNMQVYTSVDLIVAFNTEEPDKDTPYGYVMFDQGGDSLKKGSGTYTFNVTVTPKDWSSQGKDFQASAYIGQVQTEFNGSSFVPVGIGSVLTSDRKTFPVSHDYWTVTWDLNGGTSEAFWDNGELIAAKYHERVAKGGVLAQPSPDPDKAIYVSGRYTNCYVLEGWYTDSELTQKYNFANSVSTNLHLYARWEEPQNVSQYLYNTQALIGTWRYNPPTTSTRLPYTLTITANSVRFQNKMGEYLQYSNVVWAGQPTATLTSNYKTYRVGYTFTGTRTYNRSNGDWNDVIFGFIALSTDGQSVLLQRDTDRIVSGFGIANEYQR